MTRHTPKELESVTQNTYAARTEFVEAAKRYEVELARHIEAWNQYRGKLLASKMPHDVEEGKSAFYKEQIQAAKNYRARLRSTLEHFEKRGAKR
ncbi:MAG: hypothetical protein H0W99_09360 [Acidobacteria bacterium]|nr:hypothetical protein [Acidobacteriota bacterium]